MRDSVPTPSASPTAPSLSIRTIVFATDFSETSEAAQGYAVELARRLGATLHVLHVVDPPLGHAWNIETPSLSLGVLVEAWVKEAVTRLHAEVLPRVDHLVDVRLAVTVGRPASEIVRYGRRRSADLLVVGTSRAKGLPQAMLGSVARRVLHDAPCPVVTLQGERKKEMEEEKEGLSRGRSDAQSLTYAYEPPPVRHDA